MPWSSASSAGFLALCQHSAIVRCRGRLQRKRLPFDDVCELLQCVLHGIGRRQHAQPRPTRRYDEEYAPQDAARLAYDTGHLLQAADVLAVDAGVDLRGDSGGLGSREDSERVLEAAGDAAKRIVHLRPRTIDADGEAREPSMPELTHELGRHQRRGARREPHREPKRVTVRDELDEVGPLRRITAREDHQRYTHFREAPEQRLGLFGVELPRVSARLRAGSAVGAGQVAGLGRLPDSDERTVVKLRHGSPRWTKPTRRRRPSA